MRCEAAWADMLRFRGCLHPVCLCQLPVIWETESDMKIGMWHVARSSRFDMLFLTKSENNFNIMFSSSVIVSVMWLVAHCTQALCWHVHWECPEVVLTRPRNWGCALMTREEGFFKKLNSYSFHMYFPPFSIALNLINTLHAATDLSRRWTKHPSTWHQCDGGHWQWLTATCQPCATPQYASSWLSSQTYHGNVMK